MKKIGLIILMALSLNFVYSFDTAGVEGIDSTQIETVISDTLATNPEESAEETPSEPAGYSQVFMFGFLILGAMLVVWKFKNNA